MGLRFESKVAVVIGGNSGNGLAAAKAVALEGASVIITGRDPDTLRSAAQAIGHGAVARRSDISNLGDIHQPRRRDRCRFSRGRGAPRASDWIL